MRRYNQNTGQLRLVCESHQDREQNRLRIMEQLHALIEEGRRAYPDA
jgi:Mitochondrial ribosomal subunit protein